MESEYYTEIFLTEKLGHWENEFIAFEDYRGWRLQYMASRVNMSMIRPQSITLLGGREAHSG